MPKVSTYNIAGVQTGEMELNDSVFGVEVNEAVMKQAFIRQLANERLGNHATKTRAMVRGGGKKPWKQKGTGRARCGSIRSPLWVGGGTVFGPHPRDYEQKMPRKARRLAVKSALSDKVNTGELFILDESKENSEHAWKVRQIIDDSDGDHDWAITGTVDLDATQSSGEVVFFDYSVSN